MSQYYFLCGNFDTINFIYAIKSNDSDWHYFEEEDSIIDSHGSLLNLENQIILNKVHPIAITLDSDRLMNYVNNGKFMFKGKELKTFMQLSGKGTDQPSKPGRKKSSDDLVFEYGKTNPVIFLKEFEKCDDVKTDNNKLFKIRNFVNQEDKSEFSTLFFKGDWATARHTFLKKYSLAFTENKKKELSFRFEDETTLRSFVHRKMKAMSMYTSLSLENQMEMILADLPNEISNLFIVNDKLNGKKIEILEFCESVQELVEGMDAESTSTVTPTVNSEEQQVVQDLEIFNFNEDIESDVESSVKSIRSTRGRGRGRSKPTTKGLRGPGRPPKTTKSTSKDPKPSEFDFDDSSRSTTTSTSSYSAFSN